LRQLNGRWQRAQIFSGLCEGGRWRGMVDKTWGLIGFGQSDMMIVAAYLRSQAGLLAEPVLARKGCADVT